MCWSSPGLHAPTYHNPASTCCPHPLMHACVQACLKVAWDYVKLGSLFHYAKAHADHGVPILQQSANDYTHWVTVALKYVMGQTVARTLVKPGKDLPSILVP